MPQANLESRIMTLPALWQDGPDLLNQAHFYLKAEKTFPQRTGGGGGGAPSLEFGTVTL